MLQLFCELSVFKSSINFGCNKSFDQWHFLRNRKNSVQTNLAFLTTISSSVQHIYQPRPHHLLLDWMIKSVQSLLHPQTLLNLSFAHAPHFSDHWCISPQLSGALHGLCRSLRVPKCNVPEPEYKFICRKLLFSVVLLVLGFSHTF